MTETETNAIIIVMVATSLLLGLAEREALTRHLVDDLVARVSFADHTRNCQSGTRYSWPPVEVEARMRALPSHPPPQELSATATSGL